MGHSCGLRQESPVCRRRNPAKVLQPQPGGMQRARCNNIIALVFRPTEAAKTAGGPAFLQTLGS